MLLCVQRRGGSGCKVTMKLDTAIREGGGDGGFRRPRELNGLTSRRLADDFPVASASGKSASDMFAERSQALEVAWGGAWQSFEVCALRTFGPPLDSTADSALNRLYDSRYRGGGQGHRGPNYLLIRYHARPGDQLVHGPALAHF